MQMEGHGALLVFSFVYNRSDCDHGNKIQQKFNCTYWRLLLAYGGKFSVNSLEVRPIEVCLPSSILLPWNWVTRECWNWNGCEMLCWQRFSW